MTKPTETQTVKLPKTDVPSGYVAWTTKSGKVYSVPLANQNAPSLSAVIRSLYGEIGTYYGVAKVLSQGPSYCAPQMCRNIIRQGK